MDRNRLLAYGGVIVCLAGALLLRWRLTTGPPRDLSSMSLKELQERVEREPRNHWLQLELGLRYVKGGHKAAAAAAFERCLAIAPNTTEAYAYLGTMYTQRHQYRKAVQMFERAVASDSTFAPGYLEAGKLYYELHNYRRARSAADRYVSLKPDDWQGHYLRGLVYFMEGEQEKAQSSFARSVKLAPGNPASYLAAGLTYLFGQATPERLASAANWFERGIKVDSHHADLHYYLGVARFRQMEWEKAAAALQRAIQLNPTLTEAFYPLGQTLRKLGRNDESRKYLAEFERLRTADKQHSVRQREQEMAGANNVPQPAAP